MATDTPVRNEPPDIVPDNVLDDDSRAATTERAIEHVLAQEGLPGAPSFEAVRPTLLARAPSEPIFFLTAPEHTEASSEIQYYRHRIRTSTSPWTVLEQLLPYFRQHPEKGRQVLLRDGYLYTEDANLAYALVGLVGAHHLFSGDRIWIHRGQELLHASLEDGRYVYIDGPDRGQIVRLSLLDRVGEGKDPATPSLHVDFRALQAELAFDRVRVEHFTNEWMVAKLRYGDELWVKSLLRVHGPRLELEREVIPDESRRELEQARRKARRRLLAIEVLRATMRRQVEEQLPFDEPRTEVEQQDGVLRRAWTYAYEQGWESYRVHQDRYRVFDREGRPFVPQVCVDFLLDTFERASGTWYQIGGNQRGRTVGEVDFEKFVSRNELRRSRTFIDFAKTRPEWFDVHEIPPAERIAMGHKNLFFEYLAAHADDYQPGDMVFIRGKTPWDAREEHTHSFFIYDVDPMTGVPLSIAGNANTPAIWSLETEARRTPLRTLRYRVRPTEQLLARVLTSAETQR